MNNIKFRTITQVIQDTKNDKIKWKDFILYRSDDYTYCSEDENIIIKVFESSSPLYYADRSKSFKIYIDIRSDIHISIYEDDVAWKKINELVSEIYKQYKRIHESEEIEEANREKQQEIARNLIQAKII